MAERSKSYERIAGAIGAAAFQLLLGYALIAGLTVRIPAPISEALKVFDIRDMPPPPPPVEEKPPSTVPRKPNKDAPSPPNLKSRASEVVAPIPVVVVPAPPPIVAAPIAGPGDQPTSGASDVEGPGFGAGGRGRGTGGEGGGLPPRRISGRLRDSDYPRGAMIAGAGGTVSVRYTVEVDGHVSRCFVTRSSGNADLDATTCRLIEQRFRYKAARDEQGRPVRADIVEDHEWVMENVPEEPAPER